MKMIIAKNEGATTSCGSQLANLLVKLWLFDDLFIEFMYRDVDKKATLLLNADLDIYE